MLRRIKQYTRRGMDLNAKRSCEITIISFSRSICRGGLAALIGVTGKPYPSSLSCHSHPIRPFLTPSLEGKAIKLSGRTFLPPHRGSSPMGLCKRTGFLEVKRRENPVRRHFERSEMRGYVAVLHESAGISIASDYST